MIESAALLVDEVLPREPLRQWVLSVPFALRVLLASSSAEMGKVLGIVYRPIATHLIKKAGLTHATGQTGAVTLIQRFGSALNLNIDFHMLFLDGAYVTGEDTRYFRACSRRQRRNWMDSSGTSARALDATWKARAGWYGMWRTVPSRGG